MFTVIRKTDIGKSHTNKEHKNKENKNKEKRDKRRTHNCCFQGKKQTPVGEDIILPPRGITACSVEWFIVQYCTNSPNNVLRKHSCAGGYYPPLQ